MWSSAKLDYAIPNLTTRAGSRDPSLTRSPDGISRLTLLPAWLLACLLQPEHASAVAGALLDCISVFSVPSVSSFSMAQLLTYYTMQWLGQYLLLLKFLLLFCKCTLLTWKHVSWVISYFFSNHLQICMHLRWSSAKKCIKKPQITYLYNVLCGYFGILL